MSISAPVPSPPRHELGNRFLRTAAQQKPAPEKSSQQQVTNKKYVVVAPLQPADIQTQKSDSSVEGGAIGILDTKKTPVLQCADSKVNNHPFSAGTNRSSHYTYSPSSMLSIQTPTTETRDTSLDVCTPSQTTASKQSSVQRELNPPQHCGPTATKRPPSIAATTTTADNTDGTGDDDDGDSISTGSSFSLDEEDTLLQPAGQLERTAARISKEEEIAVLSAGKKHSSGALKRQPPTASSPMPQPPQKLNPQQLVSNTSDGDLSDFTTTPSPSGPVGGGAFGPSPSAGEYSRARHLQAYSANEYPVGLTPLAISLLEDSIQRGLDIEAFEADAPAIFGDQALANALRRITDERRDGYVRYGTTVVPASAVERFERSDALTLSLQLDEMSLRGMSPTFGGGLRLGSSQNGNPSSPVSLRSTYRAELANVMGSSARAGSLATPSRRALSASPSRHSVFSNNSFGGTTNVLLNATSNHFMPLSLLNRRGSNNSNGSHGSPKLPIPRRNTLVSPPAMEKGERPMPLPSGTATTCDPDVILTKGDVQPVIQISFEEEQPRVPTNTGVTRLTYTAPPRSTSPPPPPLQFFTTANTPDRDTGSSSEVSCLRRVESGTMKPAPVSDFRGCFPASPQTVKGSPSTTGRKSSTRNTKVAGSATKAILSRRSSKNSVTSGDSSNPKDAGARTRSPTPNPAEGGSSPKAPDTESPALPFMRTIVGTAEGGSRDPETTLTIFQGKKMTVAERDRRIQQEAERIEKLKNRAAAYLNYEQKGRKVLEKLDAVPQISSEQANKSSTQQSTSNSCNVLAKGPRPLLPSKPSHLSPITHRPRPLSAN